MALISHLRSRCGLHHIRLESDGTGDDDIAERIRDVLQQIKAVPDGSSWMPGLEVSYFIAGREGFRISIPEYPSIEGVDVWGSKRIVAEISRIWKEGTQ